jgi:hypothetical protein
MPLLEVQKITHVTATIAIEQSLASSVDKYAAFIHATADEVVNKALEYVFSKDKEFQKFLASDEAGSVRPSLHVRDSRNSARRPRASGSSHIPVERIFH